MIDLWFNTGDPFAREDLFDWGALLRVEWKHALDQSFGFVGDWSLSDTVLEFVSPLDEFPFNKRRFFIHKGIPFMKKFVQNNA